MTKCRRYCGYASRGATGSKSAIDNNFQRQRRWLRPKRSTEDVDMGRSIGFNSDFCCDLSVLVCCRFRSNSFARLVIKVVRSEADGCELEVEENLIDWALSLLLVITFLCWRREVVACLDGGELPEPLLPAPYSQKC